MGAVCIGVLALQGAFAAHAAAFGDLGESAVEVRCSAEVDQLDGLVIPGGESTTLLKLLDGTGIERSVRGLIERGGAIFGTCAGAILLSSRVLRPEQYAWRMIDLTIERNAYGRQVDSFETAVRAPVLGEPPLPVVFIRAPRIREASTRVEVLAEFEGSPILVRQERVLAATFHPELTPDCRVHRLFVEMVRAGRTAVATSPREA